MGFFGKLGPEAGVAAIIAIVSAVALYASFKAHVKDLEIEAQRTMARLERRIDKIDDRDWESLARCR